MADQQRLICPSSALVEKSRGVRFDLSGQHECMTGFVVRYDSEPRAFVNRCAHLPVELDWTEGDFFEPEARYLICATHGACYEPASGLCVMGPCAGAALQPLPVIERDGNIYLIVKD